MKIEINLKIILVLLLFLIVRNVNTYMLFILFILMHELFHLLVGICIGGKPRKLTLSPFGASLEFYSYGKKNPFYRILFYIIGPLSNFIVAVIFYNLEINEELRLEVVCTNLAICFFNLLPILPLDGGKILLEISKFLFNVEKANRFTILFSKCILWIISFAYAILIIKIKNVMILFLLAYLWYLYSIEEKKFYIYQKASNSIKNVI